MDIQGAQIARWLLAAFIGLLLVAAFFLIGITYVFKHNYNLLVEFRDAYHESGTLLTGVVIEKEARTEASSRGGGRGYNYYTYYDVVVRLDGHDAANLTASEPVRITTARSVYDDFAVGDEIEVAEARGEMKLVRELELLGPPPGRSTLVWGLAALGAAVVIAILRGRIGYSDLPGSVQGEALN